MAGYRHRDKGKSKAKQGAATKAMAHIYQTTPNSDQTILDKLHQHGAATARDIANDMGLRKKQVNHILYRLAKYGQVKMVGETQTPPVWQLVDSSGAEDDVISLTSSPGQPDSLQQQIDQLRQDLAKVNARIAELEN